MITILDIHPDDRISVFFANTVADGVLLRGYAEGTSYDCRLPATFHGRRVMILVESPSILDFRYETTYRHGITMYMHAIRTNQPFPLETQEGVMPDKGR